MSIAAEGSKPVAKEHRKPLFLEDYFDFIDNRARDLTATQLSQIVAMHGFKKSKKKSKYTKDLLVEMVSTMDLTDLCRSTLLDGAVSGGARFTLEEVTKDLKDLHWNECHISSIITHGAGVSESATPSGVPVKRKRQRPSRKKAAVVGAETSVISSGETVAAGSAAESLALVSRSPFPSPVAIVQALQTIRNRIRRRVKKSKKLDEIKTEG